MTHTGGAAPPHLPPPVPHICHVATIIYRRSHVLPELAQTYSSACHYTAAVPNGLGICRHHSDLCGSAANTGFIIKMFLRNSVFFHDPIFLVGLKFDGYCMVHECISF